MSVVVFVRSGSRSAERLELLLMGVASRFSMLAVREVKSSDLGRRNMVGKGDGARV